MIFLRKRNSDKFQRHTRQTPFKVTQHDNKGTNDRQTTKTFNFVSNTKKFLSYFAYASLYYARMK